jgi:hypothetical protein
VKCSDPKNGEVEQAICAAMRLKPDWCYVADHVIGESSELHTVCQLPIGKVTLTRADALEGVRNLIKKQRAKLFFCSEPSPQFKRILTDIEAGKQEKLLQQVQPKSEEHLGKIQKAIYRARTELETMGDWTTRYDHLADHLSQYIRGGIVFQYTGPYRWKIEGLAEIPDTLDLADDHVQFKRSKIAKQKRKAKGRCRLCGLLSFPRPRRRAVVDRWFALKALTGWKAGIRKLVTNVDVESSKLPFSRTHFCSSLRWLSIPTSSFVVLHRNT